MWLSLVERSVRDREVVGSNPAIPTIRLRRWVALRPAVFVSWSRIAREPDHVPRLWAVPPAARAFLHRRRPPSTGLRPGHGNLRRHCRGACPHCVPAQRGAPAWLSQCPRVGGDGRLLRRFGDRWRHLLRGLAHDDERDPPPHRSWSRLRHRGDSRPDAQRRAVAARRPGPGSRHEQDASSLGCSGCRCPSSSFTTAGRCWE